MRANREEILSVRNLTMAVFISKDLTPELAEWKEKAEIPMVESCARQVWYGRDCDFADFPDASPGVLILKAEQAYAFFLRLMSDIDNTKNWACEAPADIRRLRESFLERYPDKEYLLARLQEQLTADNKLIRREILSKMLPCQFKDAVRDVSRQSKGETVILIGAVGRHGQLSEYTEDIARVVAKNGSGRRVNEVIVTNPISSIPSLIKKELEILKPQIIDRRVRITPAPFQDLPLYFDLCERAYVDLPMNEDHAADAFIMKSWRERNNTDNTLTHMRGSPPLRGLTTPEWQDFTDESEHSSVLLPEDCKTRVTNLIANNTKFRSMGMSAFTIAASRRGEGDGKNRASIKDILGTDHSFPMPKIPSCG